MAEVVIYTRDFCYYSDAARELLTRKGVAFKDINATGKRELRAEMIEKANGATSFTRSRTPASSMRCSRREARS